MVTAEERANLFKAELKEFLKKWGTSIELEEESRGYFTDTKMVCYLDGVYRDCEYLEEFTTIDLGTCIDPD